MSTNLNNRFAELTIERDLYLSRDAMMHMQRSITLSVSTTLNARSHSGKNIILSGAGVARTHTLPRSTGSGRKFKFYVGAVNTTGGYIIKSSNGLDVMKGSVIFAATAVGSFTAAATSDTFTFNGTTTGGVAVGDWVEFTDLLPNTWAVTGMATASGTLATPFSDTVA